MIRSHRNNNVGTMLDRPQNKHLKPVKPGEVRNPTGRPKGSRNKLSDAFLKALADDFEVHSKRGC